MAKQVATASAGAAQRPGRAVSSTSVVVSEPVAVSSAFPLLAPNAPFLLLVDPRSWQVFEGKLLPDVRNFDLLPGLNNVSVAIVRDAHGHASSRVVWGPALEQQKRLGMIPIPQEEAPDGVSYLRVCRVDGGLHHHLQWAEPHVGTDRVTVDRAGYATWLEGLVRKGLIPQPETWVLEKLRAELQRHGDRAADRSARIPSLKLKAERFASMLAVVEAELDRRRGTEAKATSTPVTLPSATP